VAAKRPPKTAGPLRRCPIKDHRMLHTNPTLIECMGRREGASLRFTVASL
jgi:hypothetical protein